MPAKKSLSVVVRAVKKPNLANDLIILNEIKPSTKTLRKYIAIISNLLSSEQRTIIESIPGLKINGSNRTKA